MNLWHSTKGYILQYNWVHIQKVFSLNFLCYTSKLSLKNCKMHQLKSQINRVDEIISYKLLRLHEETKQSV